MKHRRPRLPKIPSRRLSAILSLRFPLRLASVLPLALAPLVSLALVLPSLTAQAQPAPAPAADPAPVGSLTLEQLLAAIGGKPSQEARFVEKKYLAVLDAPVESAGLLRYQAPGRLERITERPERIGELKEKSPALIARAQHLLVVPSAVNPGGPFFILDGCFTHVCHRLQVERR